MNTFRPIMWLVGAFIFAYAVYSFVTKGFLGSLNMNFVIFLFVGVNCFLFPEPHQWMEAHTDSMHLATDIILQFPFYGAIMGMMYLDGGLVLCWSMLSRLSPPPTPCRSLPSCRPAW